jgi:hypothetical protein
MRSSRFVVLLSLVTIAPLGWAQKQMQSQAEQDGLAGRVNSVATIVEASDVHWLQPSGPTLLFPVVCRDCTYSQDGYRTKSGTIVDGKFMGENIALSRDPDGRVTGVVATDAANDEVSRSAVMGPFGKTEETFYRNGSVTARNTLRYDSFGRLLEMISFDATGAEVDRTLTTWGKDDWTGRTAWGKAQQVRLRATFDPAENEDHFSTFDESGNPAVNWTYAHGQVPAFWSASDEPDQYGAAFSDFDDKANPIAFHCRNHVCNAAKIHYEYADAAKRNPASAEWRDGNGNLLYGAYYTYQFDAHGNWTHREVSVWNAELGARTPYETDDRMITYW